MRENCSGGGVQEGWNSQGDLEQRASEIARRSERLTRDRKVPGSSPRWSGGRIFFSRVKKKKKKSP